VIDAPARRSFKTRLGSYIKRTELALMAEKTRVLTEHGLTVAQYSALMLLRYVPEASAAQLSRACLVPPQTMATILSNLEQKGLVTREPSALHQRVLSTQLTADRQVGGPQGRPRRQERRATPERAVHPRRA
jgi:hypothetical protein